MVPIIPNPAFSIPEFWTVLHFPVPHFQSPTGWKSLIVSRESPPQLGKNEIPAEFIGLRVSRARGWKMCEVGRDEYIIIIIIFKPSVPYDPEGFLQKNYW